MTASATAVTYNFDSFRNAPFTGLLLADLQQPVPAGTATTLPVYFGGVRLLAANGAEATVADIGGVGATSLILVYFNSRNNRLQLVGRYEAPAAAPATPAT